MQADPKIVDYRRALAGAAAYLERRAKTAAGRPDAGRSPLAPDAAITWRDLRYPMPALDPLLR
ncbi:hypothetical protein [Hansschlegelia sp. KR7-227]|uniref:hypothetical protein n=1 Tax=Hansschlegelia sp. KR7-227 TaxID=3400914 RepID=UPI003C055AE0